MPGLQPQSGDPTELLATGPFQLPAFGDRIEVAFALVGGADIPALQQHARPAQALADAGYRIALVGVPEPRTRPRITITPSATPTTSSLLSFVLDLPTPGEVRVDLLDLAGRAVAMQSLGHLASGSHTVVFTPTTGLAPGVYLARLVHSSGTATARVVRLRH